MKWDIITETGFTSQLPSTVYFGNSYNTSFPMFQNCAF